MKLPVLCDKCRKVWAVPRRDWPYDWNRVACKCGGWAYVYGTPAEIKAFQRSGDLERLRAHA